VPASSSPHVVPVPLSNHANVGPEEAYVAAISSCHMLFFLNLAAKRTFVIDSYEDAAVGEMTKEPDGKSWMSRINLRPNIVFQAPGSQPPLRLRSFTTRPMTNVISPTRSRRRL
jgi:organic hydroperoxide reductase OsmC/OhrA